MSESEFVVDQVLGQGSFGTCCKVHDRFGDVYALKKINLQGHSPDYIYFLCNEARMLLRATRSDYVVRLVDTWVKRNASGMPISLFLLEELCSQGDLGQRITSSQGGMEELEVLKIAIDICKGLTYLHSIGMLHSYVI